jgi:hypothetical protein
MTGLSNYERFRENAIKGICLRCLQRAIFSATFDEKKPGKSSHSDVGSRDGKHKSRREGFGLVPAQRTKKSAMRGFHRLSWPTGDYIDSQILVGYLGLVHRFGLEFSKIKKTAD